MLIDTVYDLEVCCIPMQHLSKVNTKHEKTKTYDDLKECLSAKDSMVADLKSRGYHVNEPSNMNASCYNESNGDFLSITIRDRIVVVKR